MCNLLHPPHGGASEALCFGYMLYVQYIGLPQTLGVPQCWHAAQTLWHDAHCDTQEMGICRKAYCRLPPNMTQVNRDALQVQTSVKRFQTCNDSR
jgi:hypothetical protein